MRRRRSGRNVRLHPFARHAIHFADSTSLDVKDVAEGALVDEVDSWMTGINRNVGKTTRYVARYSGSNKEFRTRCNAVSADGYKAFRME